MAAPASGNFYQSSFWIALKRQALARDRRTCVVPGCRKPATHVDHIATRPHSPDPTSADVLTNLRSLCASHDAQVKEDASGKRKRGGRFTVRGADADGWPLDPARSGTGGR